MSRSLSPPSSKTVKTVPAWKMQADEEAIYRAEVLSQHYPKDDDAWMQREMTFLTQFTRIFPPQQNKQNKDENLINVEEENRDDDNDEEDGNGSQLVTDNKTYKASSYEDIMFQVLNLIFIIN